MTTEKIVHFLRIALLAGIVILLLGWAWNYYSNDYKNSASYLEQPEHWVTENDGVTYIDISKVTQQRAGYDSDTDVITYNDGTIYAAFQTYGLYHGDYFSSYAQDGTLAVIELGPNMDPNNGIMQVFVVESFEEGIPYIHLFVDEDWKKVMPQTNLIWGKNFSNQQPAQFTEIAQGIYHTQVQDELDRFIQPQEGVWQQVGGMLVGDMTREDWFSNTLDEVIVIHFN